MISDSCLGAFFGVWVSFGALYDQKVIWYIPLTLLYPLSERYYIFLLLTLDTGKNVCAKESLCESVYYWPSTVFHRFPHSLVKKP